MIPAANMFVTVAINRGDLVRVKWVGVAANSLRAANENCAVVDRPMKTKYLIKHCPDDLWCSSGRAEWRQRSRRSRLLGGVAQVRLGVFDATLFVCSVVLCVSVVFILAAVGVGRCRGGSR